VTDLLEQHWTPESHRHVPDVLLAEAPQLPAGIGLRVGVVEEAHQVAFRRQVGLDRRLDANRQHVLLEQERRDIEGERREIPVVTAQQPAVEPDVGDQKGALEPQQRPLPVFWTRKTHPVPDRFVATGGTMQARHGHGRPAVVVEVEPRKAAILALAERRNRHPPPGGQLLLIEGLGGKERQAIVERHGQVVLSGMTPSTERTR
jgi:hypothetical protein